MKKQESFGIDFNNSMDDENRLWLLCEQFGNQTDGVSIFFLRKRLIQNGIKDFPKFMKCNINDFIKFDNIGPKKAAIFVKMQEYWENNNDAI